MAKNAQRILYRLAPWALPLALVILWQIAVETGWLSNRILPAPSAVLAAFWSLSQSGELWQHLSISSQRALIGFAIGGSIGLILGFITGLSRWGERLLDSSVQMIRNVPHLALIPLVILWFGIDESAKIFLVALGTLFPIYLNTYHGIKNIDRGLLEMARSYGLSGFRLFTQVVLPGALPSIMVGVRFALGFMWLTLIVAETISANSGIGYLAMNAREFLQTDVVVVAIVLYALLGKLADVGAQLLERVWLRWHPAYQLKQEKRYDPSRSPCARHAGDAGVHRQRLRQPHRAGQYSAAHFRRAVRGGGRPQRLRQEHPAAPAGRPGTAQQRRAAQRQRAACRR